LSELEAKKARLADLSQRFTEQYPEIRRSKAEIAALEAHIAEIRKNAPDNSTASSASPAARRAAPGEPRTASGFASRETEALQRHKTEVAALDMEIRSLKKEREEIGKRIASFEEKVARSPKREQEMISLTRDYDNLKRSYDELLRKKLDADVAQNLEKRQKGEQFQILDPANLPEEPFVPNRPKVFLIAVFCAQLVGFGGSVGLEITDPTVREKKEFGHFTEILVLATIPSIHDKVFARRMVMRKAAIFGGLITFTLLVTAFLIVFGERVRTILQGVM
jgi:uncharacterized protein involved in exopolysaccharide biosynthesis